MKKITITILSALLATGGLACSPNPQVLAQSQRANTGLQAFAQTQSPLRRDANALIRQFHVALQKRAPEMIQMKYKAMKEGAFPFYRATAFLYYHDARKTQALNSPVQVTLQGDFHLENMGTYRTSRGQYAYDLNDFDEAFKGPYTWDLARLGSSIHLAAEEVGLPLKSRQAHVSHFLNRYVFHLQTLLKQPSLLAQPLGAQFLTEKPAKQVVQAREFKRSEFLSEMVAQNRFIPGKKIRPIAPQTRQDISRSVQQYAAQRPEGVSFFQVKDIAARIAGKGSLGRYRYVALIEGRSPASHDDHILELKEAIVPSAYAFSPQASRQNAQRIVQSYRYFLPQADPFLGSTKVHGLDAFVREYLPKETVNLEKVNKNEEYTAFLESVALIAARAHARSGKSSQILSDAKSAQALTLRIAPFAEQYAGQVRRDYQSFRQRF